MAIVIKKNIPPIKAKNTPVAPKPETAEVEKPVEAPEQAGEENTKATAGNTAVTESAPPSAPPPAPNPPPPPAPAPVQKVKITPADDDLVSVTVFADIEPPPIVGNFNVGARLGISKMTMRQSYKVPRYVALVIVDAKKGIIV